jgi:deoxyribonuclease-4
MASNTASEPYVGAHMSISGGLHLAVQRALHVDCRALQIFTKNASQWKAKPLSGEAVELFRTAREESGLGVVFAHDSYLINLASPDPLLLAKSIAAMGDELERAERLGLPFVVSHPGAHKGDGEAAGLARVAHSLDEVHRQHPDLEAKILIETTAGQGTSLGFRFEHLASIIEQVEQPERLGVCLDTCHIFAAGYDLRTPESWNRTMDEFQRLVGFEWLQAIHVNDSKKDLGSRVDRHDHIGKGALGLESFRYLMQDQRLEGIPKVLETHKGPDLEDDRRNLATLRQLASEKR